MSDPIEQQADAAARDVAAAAAEHGPHAAYEQAREEIAHALHRHPSELRAHRSTGQIAADVVANRSGSWPLIIGYIVFTVAYLLTNHFVFAFDVTLQYDTFLVSVIAIFLAQVILLSRKRAADQDRAEAENNDAQTGDIHRMQCQQMEILATMQHILQVGNQINDRLDDIEDRQ